MMAPPVEAPETPPVSSDEPEVVAPVVTEETGVVEPPVEEVVPPVEEPTSWIDFNPEVPEELLDELKEDEPEEEATSEWDGFEDDHDPELLKRLAKAEKEAAHFKSLRVKEKSKDWAAEAIKFFPLSETVVPEIKADSRRSFLKQAKEAHDTLLPFAKRFADQAQVSVAEATEAATAKAKAEAAEAWGQAPKSDPAEDEAAAISADRMLSDGRREGNLHKSILAMMKGGKST